MFSILKELVRLKKRKKKHFKNSVIEYTTMNCFWAFSCFFFLQIFVHFNNTTKTLKKFLWEC